MTVCSANISLFNHPSTYLIAMKLIWFTNSASHSKIAAFLFADAGFDVWLGNARGNTYSKNHVNLTSKDEKFWEFRLETPCGYFTRIYTLFWLVLHSLIPRVAFILSFYSGKVRAKAQKL